MKDPKQYAYDFIQLEFLKAIPKFAEAYKSGKQFSKANQGVILKNNKRFYIDHKKIDNKLPAKYGIGNTINHPEQECLNCKYFVQTRSGDYCAQWDAEVREEYWCKKWKAIGDE